MPRKKSTRAGAGARASARATAMQSVVVNVGAKPAPRRRRTVRRTAVAPAVMQLPPLMINTAAHTAGQPFQPVPAMLAPVLPQAASQVLAGPSNSRVDGLRPTSATMRPSEFVDPETGFAKWGQAAPLSPPQRAVPSNLEDAFERLALPGAATAAGAVADAAGAARGTTATAAPGERPRGGLSSTDRDRRDRPLAIAQFPDLTIKEALKQYRAEQRGDVAAVAAPGPQ